VRGVETDFEVLGQIEQVQLIAAGHGIRELARLRKVYGGVRWRKLKGVALVKLPDGSVRRGEIHWYEAHGVGRKKMKIKRILD
jgi:hypothetical protein